MRGWEHLAPADVLKLGRQPQAKYRNTKTNGFDSKKEAQRYHDLTLQQKAGLIRALECQVPFALYASNGEKVAVYIADFQYVDCSSGKITVEDVKGGEATRTRLYLLKRKLLRAQGIEITEV